MLGEATLSILLVLATGITCQMTTSEDDQCFTLLASEINVNMNKMYSEMQTMSKALSQIRNGECSQCSEGWTKINSSCYYVPNVKLPREDARNYCRAMHSSDLAEIADRSEHQALIDSFPGYIGLYVGARKLSDEDGGQFYWESCQVYDGGCHYTQVDEDLWNVNQPDGLKLGVDQKWVVMLFRGGARGFLHDALHEADFNFICEYKL